jgi:hypothetical protein
VRGRGSWLATVAVVALGLAGCSAGEVTSAEDTDAPPVVLAPAPGTDVQSVTLSEHAAQRLGIESVAITAVPHGLAVPYSAVLYSADGSAWVYTVSKPLTYVRAKVVVANVSGQSGNDAVLSQGPAVGTIVVKTGVDELYGAEVGVGE